MKKPLAIASGTLAALFIDLQEEHRRDKRYLVEGFDAVLENAGRLQAAARRHHVPLLHAAYIVDATTASPHNPVGDDGTPVFSAKGDPLTDICPEVVPRHGEPLIVKTDPSVFGAAGFDEQLGNLGVEWLLVCGVWTEACVDATVKDAVRRGYRVLLVKDACGSGTAAMHRAGILNLANRLYRGAVVDTETACRLIGGETIEAWQVEGAVPIRFTFETAADDYLRL